VSELAAYSRQQGLRVLAIGLTCAAHIGVLLDGHNRVLRRAILWNDQRAAAQAEALNSRHAGLILHQSGQAASAGWTLAHVAWVRENEPTLHAQVRRVLLSKDYLAWRFTGAMATDPATAVSAQFFDVTKNAWSNDLAGLAGLSADMLPPVLPSHASAGKLLAQWSQAMGLPTGLAVVIGSLDSATEMLAARCTKPGQGLIRLATAGGLQLVSAGLCRDPRRITYPHIKEPCWYVQAGTSSCAAAVQWARESFARDWSWQEIERRASQIPAGSQGLIFHPYLQGERAPYWSAKLKARFTGLTISHGTGHLLRSVFEGTAFSIRDAMRVMSDLPRDDGPFAVVGGGSHNRLWVQVLADVLNRPLRPMPQADSACGAAMLAWQGLGTPIAGEQAHALDDADVIEPCAKSAAVYDGLFTQYQAIARQMLA
jgi:xylulokinase